MGNVGTQTESQIKLKIVVCNSIFTREIQQKPSGWMISDKT